MADFIELGEARMERWTDENVYGDWFKCSCGEFARLSEGIPSTPDPYSPPMCPRCYDCLDPPGKRPVPNQFWGNSGLLTRIACTLALVGPATLIAWVLVAAVAAIAVIMFAALVIAMPAVFLWFGIRKAKS